MSARIFFGLILSALISGGFAGLFFGSVSLLFTVPIAIVAAVVLGLPVYFLLRRLGWLQPWQLALAGACCASPALFLLPLRPYFAAVVLLSGLLAGWLFWAAAVKA